jgi:TATA-box binding protein (TBP) (component of TFIID and TFIIIB)
LSEHGIIFKKYRFKAQRYDWQQMKEYDRPPQKMTRKNSKMKGVFYNQVTLEIYSEVSKKAITTFLYDNGSCNNTGNRVINDTFIVCEKLCEYLNEFHKKKRPIMYHYRNVNLSNWEDTQTDELEATLDQSLMPLDLSKGKLICKNLNVSTMNAKYNAGIKINRDNLLRLLKRKISAQKDTNIYLALLETSNYAGLNVKVRWGKACTESVHQKLKKRWKCGCSDITVLIFQSGEIMISGAKNTEQLQYVKDIFDRLISDNIQEIIDIDLLSIIELPTHKRVKKIHRYVGTSNVGDKTFVVVSES